MRHEEPNEEEGEVPSKKGKTRQVYGMYWKCSIEN